MSVACHHRDPHECVNVSNRPGHRACLRSSREHPGTSHGHGSHRYRKRRDPSRRRGDRMGAGGSLLRRRRDRARRRPPPGAVLQRHRALRVRRCRAPCLTSVRGQFAAQPDQGAGEQAETCIWESPTWAAISVWVSPPKNRSSRILRSRSGNAASSGARSSRCSTRSNSGSVWPERGGEPPSSRSPRLPGRLVQRCVGPPPGRPAPRARSRRPVRGVRRSRSAGAAPA